MLFTVTVFQFFSNKFKPIALFLRCVEHVHIYTQIEPVLELLLTCQLLVRLVQFKPIKNGVRGEGVIK